jgi:hypothetical protein
MRPADEDDENDVEGERLLRLAQINGEEGPDWPARFKPGTFGCHELMDRASVLAAEVEGRLLEHPACAMNADWYALAATAMALLNELSEKVADAEEE